MRLKGKKVAYLVEEGFEDLEFWVPVMRLREEGAEVVIVGTGRQREFQGKHGLKARPDTTADRVRAADFDAVVIPGGWAPDKLRRHDGVKRLVRDAYAQDRIVGAICHAGWVPISAGVVRGHRATGAPAIRDDLENAGAQWVDAAAFRDGNFVWGRVVEDIPDFCRALVEAIATHVPGPQREEAGTIIGHD
ncbi:MAG: type 1 glutamine amidotransferase [Gemmatimonadetes bacterium]|nr:type 1 glutamine amidotransferase [Gemmatimonadota bacterium]